MNQRLLKSLKSLHHLNRMSAPKQFKRTKDSFCLQSNEPNHQISETKKKQTLIHFRLSKFDHFLFSRMKYHRKINSKIRSSLFFFIFSTQLCCSFINHSMMWNFNEHIFCFNGTQIMQSSTFFRLNFLEIYDFANILLLDGNSVSKHNQLQFI